MQLVSFDVDVAAGNNDILDINCRQRNFIENTSVGFATLYAGLDKAIFFHLGDDAVSFTVQNAVFVRSGSILAQKIINFLQTGVKTILQLNHICSNILLGIEPILTCTGGNLDAAEAYAAFFTGNNIAVRVKLRISNLSAATDGKLQIIMDACAYIFTAGNIHIVGNCFARSYLAQGGGGNGTAAAGTLIDVVFAGGG